MKCKSYSPPFLMNPLISFIMQIKRDAQKASISSLADSTTFFWIIGTSKKVKLSRFPKHHPKTSRCLELGIFFRGWKWGLFSIMVNIFTCRRPNRSKVGAIDSLDLFEQVLDQRYIPEVSEKIFTHDISMIRRQKMVIFGVLKVFISNFTYYNFY